MVDRRTLIKTAGAGALLSGVPALRLVGGGAGQDPSSPRDCVVFDAMGELRDVYTPELLREMLASGLNAITVTLCDPKTFEDGARRAALDGVRSYDRYIASLPDVLLKATSVSDLERARRERKLAVFYLFQNSTQFGRDLGRVDEFYGLGVRSSQITYNFQNWAGSGCKERTRAGLTHFGMALVEKMNSVRMLIDLSHASMATMADAIRASKVPVVVSHTACAAVFPHERNTTDASLRLLAERGGVVGICQIRPFIVNIRKGAFERYLAHILHAVDVAGADHVAIGSDRDHRVIKRSAAYLAELKAEQGDNFSEADWPLFMDELNGPRRMEVIWNALGKKGLSARVREKVMGKNLQRVYREVIG